MDEISGKTVFPLKEAYPFGERHGLSREVEEVRQMEIEWDSCYTSSVRRGYVIELFKAKGLLDAFLREYWPKGLTDEGKANLRFWCKVKRRYEDFLAGRGQQIITADVDEESSEDQAFAAETDLRDFLAGNLECIEKGLRLYTKDGTTGVEYAIDDGRIDILAVDKDGCLVVIELKVSRGRNKALGQILYYMGWVDQHFGNGPCRGMIVAKEIADDLKLAVQRTASVSLCSYSLSVSVNKVT